MPQTQRKKYEDLLFGPNPSFSDLVKYGPGGESTQTPADPASLLFGGQQTVNEFKAAPDPHSNDYWAGAFFRPKIAGDHGVPFTPNLTPNVSHDPVLAPVPSHDAPKFTPNPGRNRPDLRVISFPLGPSTVVNAENAPGKAPLSNPELIPNFSMAVSHGAARPVASHGASAVAPPSTPIGAGPEPVQPPAANPDLNMAPPAVSVDENLLKSFLVPSTAAATPVFAAPIASRPVVEGDRDINPATGRPFTKDEWNRFHKQNINPITGKSFASDYEKQQFASDNSINLGAFRNNHNTVLNVGAALGSLAAEIQGRMEPWGGSTHMNGPNVGQGSQYWDKWMKERQAAQQWDRNRPAAQFEANMKAQGDLSARQKVQADVQESQARGKYYESMGPAMAGMYKSGYVKDPVTGQWRAATQNELSEIQKSEVSKNTAQAGQAEASAQHIRDWSNPNSPFYKLELYKAQMPVQKEMRGHFTEAQGADAKLIRMMNDTKNPNAQNDMDLLMNHMGMTGGAQTGFRMTESEIRAHASARGLGEEVIAMWSHLKNGQSLTPEQRQRMLRLGWENRQTLWHKAFDAADIAGVQPPPGSYAVYGKMQVPAELAMENPAIAQRKVVTRDVVEAYAKKSGQAYEQTRQALADNGWTILE